MERTQIAAEDAERRLFTFEERQSILKSTNNICACCGKKLTTKTMTVEHIIPISRGGTNDIKNLTALCYDCNQHKRNLLYLPQSFYMALIGKPRLTEMEIMVRTWFLQNMREQHDIQQYPLIAPNCDMLMPTFNNYARSKPKYNKQLLLSWSLVGIDTIDEIEAVTDINLENIRAMLYRPRPGISAWEENHRFFSIPVTFYALRKISNQKILALMAVRYDKTQNDLIVYLVWADTTKKAHAYIFAKFLSTLINSICDIAQYQINDIFALSNYNDTFEPIVESGLGRQFCHDYQFATLYDEYDQKDISTLIMYRNPGMPDIHIKDYIELPKWLTLKY